MVFENRVATHEVFVLYGYVRRLFGLFSVTFRLYGFVVIYLRFSCFIRFTTVILRIMGYIGTKNKVKRDYDEGRSTGCHTRQASSHRAAVNAFGLTSMTVLFFRFFDNRMSHIYTYTCTTTLSHIECFNICLI